jgi:integrase
MSIQETNGRYYPVIWVRDERTGKRHRVSGGGFATKKEAERAERKLLVDRDDNRPTDRSKETVEQFLRRWLTIKETEGLRPKTLEGYRDHVLTRWIPAIGHLRMTELYAHPDHILDAQADWLKNGVEVRNRGKKVKRKIPSPTTIHHYRATLRAALRDNRRRHGGQVPEPSEIAGGIPATDTAEVVTLDEVESRALLAAAATADPTDMHVQLLLFGLQMGMREGELLGLRQRDVDRARGVVYVRQTVAQLRGRGLVIQTNQAKNKASKAPVELTIGADQVLVRAAAIRSGQIQLAGSAWDDNNLVFSGPLGGPLAPTTVRRRFKALLELAGVAPIRVHDLRHTHATLLLADGAHPKVIQERLRHSRISVTMDTYSHVIPTMRSGATERMDRMLGTVAEPRAEAVPHAP